VTKTFGGGIFSNVVPTVAVDDVSLTISEDDPSIITIAGESGSGKTTLARLLLGNISPTSGVMRYRGQNLKTLTRSGRRNFRREVQAIYQDPFGSYNPFYKVDHVLEAPIRNFKLASSNAAKQRLIEESLEMVGLQPHETLGRFPHQLSGGQRQRIMVARALLLKPRVILADEPVSMVDASLRATILDSIRRLNRELGISIVYITHDLTTAFQITDNIVVLYKGTIAEAGAVEKVILSPKHPYTQLLVESIPQPDPEKRWGSEPTTSKIDETGVASRGCKFADRCPAVMEVCWESPPPLYRLEDKRAVTCFLYRDSQPMENNDITQVFQRMRQKEMTGAGAT